MEQIQKIEKLWPELRISVAMATYNGEKYIEEQLLSICRQTRKPDEIVVSDDGSKDKTLEIVERVSKSADAQGIDFVVITDNPRHGYCGNFEWALKHTTGDLIFLSDQDDVWMLEKVERICFAKSKHPDAMCIIHNAMLIDEFGKTINGEFHKVIKLDKLPTDLDNIAHIDQSNMLVQAASVALANGMVMCIARDLFDVILPFPETAGLHDSWIGFSALCKDQCWYVSEILTKYRLHGSNTCGNSARKARIIPKIKRIYGKLKNGGSAIMERFYLGKAMLDQLNRQGLNKHPAYDIVCRVYEIGEIQVQAYQVGGLRGAIKLLGLFCNDIRYRRSGTADFCYQLLGVLTNRKTPEMRKRK